MKFLYIILFLFLSFKVFSQEKEINEKVYIYIESAQFTWDVLGYKAYFHIKDESDTFNYDSFFFRIDYPNLDEHSLYSLGTKISVEDIEILKPQDYFHKEKFDSIHTALSIWNKYKSLYIITEIPKERMISEPDKKNKYMIWPTSYVGTMKDFFITSKTKSLILVRHKN
ncbi:hypothetical protein ACFQ3R_07770 [Mesonia ostreae]|uniref:Uncharacterized protein n=1 Tax=Mesonia ostreae TaxID=861110 RepID=A0ABU2KM51_9FLAO|nr:hypothetical protein [Mesonia ostreae]MDT0295791.1 hypothetical protein [Mesonia ostreae]